MLNILEAAGQQPSLPLDRTGFTADDEFNRKLPVVTKMVSGRLVALGYAGATLADSTSGEPHAPVGFLIDDAAGHAYRNRAGQASQRLAYCPLTPGVLVETDQVVAGQSFRQGDPVFCGAESTRGLVTRNSAGGEPAAAIITDGGGAGNNLQIDLAHAGTIGNSYRIKIGLDSSLAADADIQVERIGNDITVRVRSGHTGTDLRTALVALSYILDVQADTTLDVALTVSDIDSATFVNFIGGSRGVKPIGYVEGDYDANNSVMLRIHIIGSGL